MEMKVKSYSYKLPAAKIVASFHLHISLLLKTQSQAKPKP